MLTNLLQNFASFLSKKPLIVLAIILFLLGMSATYWSNFKLDASSDSLVLENDEDMKYYREISKEY